MQLCPAQYVDPFFMLACLILRPFAFPCQTGNLIEALTLLSFVAITFITRGGWRQLPGAMTSGEPLPHLRSFNAQSPPLFKLHVSANRMFQRLLSHGVHSPVSASLTIAGYYSVSPAVLEVLTSGFSTRLQNFGLLYHARNRKLCLLADTFYIKLFEFYRKHEPAFWVIYGTVRNLKHWQLKLNCGFTSQWSKKHSLDRPFGSDAGCHENCSQCLEEKR